MGESGAYLFDTDDVTVVAARWFGDPGTVLVNEWGSVELALPRSGCLAYRDQRGRDVADVTRCLLIPPQQEARTAHLTPGGLLESMLFFCPAVIAAVGLHSDDVPLSAAVTPAMQAAHRRLLAAAARRADAFVLQETALGLLAAALAQTDGRAVAAGRPSTAMARRRVVEEARVLLNLEPTLSSIVALASRLEVSPHHLSRIFHEHTGLTLGEYRTQLRVNLVLEHLCTDTGEHTLADIAADCGFADHAHMTRTVRRHTGHTPAALRVQVSRDTGRVAPPK
jgi:transcriptional regulator GlxA family with amidase domain